MRTPITVIFILAFSFGTSFCAFTQAETPSDYPEEWTEEQIQAVKQRSEELMEAHQERLKNSAYPKLSPENQVISDAKLSYNQNRDAESFEIVKEAMSPESESEMKMVLVRGLRVDEQTLPLFTNVIRDDEDDDLKGIAILRLREITPKKAAEVNVAPEVVDLLETMKAYKGGKFQNVLQITLDDLRQQGFASEGNEPQVADLDDLAELPSPPESKESTWWPWALGGVIVLALLGFLLLRRSEKD